ncbi:hypothetical protein EPN44_10395 [bacterium]|nr:MAG: hypothetical protein EPN44_10395 [bacterium]
MNMRRVGLPMLVLALVAGCSRANAPKNLADTVTKAVYSNDISHVAERFNALIRPQLTRSSVGALSDKMHAQGDYQGLEQVQTGGTGGVYGYAAKFSHGSMLVCMKLDQDGKIAGYRVEPLGAGQPSPSTENPCAMLK